MNIKEIRVGNWLNTKLGKTEQEAPLFPDQVRAIGTSKIMFGGNTLFNSSFHKPTDLAGIIVTDFILERIGAFRVLETWLIELSTKEKHIRRLLALRNNVLFIISGSEELSFSQFEQIQLLQGEPGKKIELHILQNIYLDITGEDLPITKETFYKNHIDA